MVKAELFKRYIWLVDLIYRNDGITRDEINRMWSISPFNDDKESEIPERTFHRHKNAVKELFGIDIICNRHGQKGYHIADRDNISQDGALDWMLNSISVNNILSECKDLSDRILFESVPTGQHFLSPIVEAMRKGKVVTLSYQSFRMDSPEPHDVEPYCLKIYKQRWYLIGRRVERDLIRTFALDRIKGLEVTGRSFVLPESFDAKRYFADTIGIIVEDGYKPESVIFRAFNGQQNYLRSLPLHPSQIELVTGSDEAIFSIFAQPNHDLLQEFLRYGENLTVISPKWFRDKFREIAYKMSNNYREDQDER